MGPGDSPPPGGGKRLKRQWRTADFSHFFNNVNQSNEGKFMIAQRLDGDTKFKSINKGAANQFLKTRFKHGISKARPTKDGHLIFIANSAVEGDKAVGDHKLDEKLPYEIRISYHGTLNTAKGTFYSPDLREDSIESILEQVSPQGVAKIERMKTFKNGTLTETDRYILTFNSTSIPEKINIFYYEFPLDTFYDNPLRCTQCQAYGHTRKFCTSTYCLANALLIIWLTNNADQKNVQTVTESIQPMTQNAPSGKKKNLSSACRLIAESVRWRQGANLNQ